MFINSVYPTVLKAGYNRPEQIWSQVSVQQLTFSGTYLVERADVKVTEYV